MRASERSTGPSLVRRTGTLSRRNRLARPNSEALEGRQLLSGSQVPNPPSSSAAIVRQTYRTLVGVAPTAAQTGALLQVQAKAGNYGVTAAIVGSRGFYVQTAGGRAHRYVLLAAATLDVYPDRRTVDRLTA